MSHRDLLVVHPETGAIVSNRMLTSDQVNTKPKPAKVELNELVEDLRNSISMFWDFCPECKDHSTDTRGPVNHTEDCKLDILLTRIEN